MAVCEEDRDCGVCYQPFTQWERVPRVLHCHHILCTLCLKRMCQPISSLLAIRCPFCRWTTCVGPNLTLQEGLWVHAKLWDQIAECEVDCENDEEEAEEEKGKEQEKLTQLTRQSKWPSLKRYKLHLQVPPFLKGIFGHVQRAFRSCH